MIEPVIELWKKGLTSGQIASELNINRNQVAGVIWRAQQKGVIPKRRDLMPKVARPPKPKRERTITLAKVKFPVIKDNFIPKEEVPPVKTNGTKKLIELGLGDCRWIYDDGLYCGEGTNDYLRPWCAYHRKLVYVRPTVNKEGRKPFTLKG